MAKYFLAGASSKNRGHHYAKPTSSRRRTVPSIASRMRKSPRPVVRNIVPPAPTPVVETVAEEEKKEEPQEVSASSETATKEAEEEAVDKPVEEMTANEFEKNFEAKGKKPTYDQRRALLGKIPVTPPGKPLANLIDWDNIPPYADPPSGLVYNDVKFSGAPKGVQALLRNWIEEFRKGMAEKSPQTLNFLLQGPPGTGKTEALRYLSQDTGLPLWNIQGENLDPMALFGNYTKDKNGNVVFQEGTLVTAVRGGGILNLDELNAFPQDVQIRINSLLDDRRTLYLRETGEVIKADPELIIFATMNPPGEGTHVLIPQIKSRLQKRLWMPLPSEDDQLQIIKKRLSLSSDKFDKIHANVKRAVSLIRKMNMMELSYYPTLREAITIGRDLNNGNDLSTSLQTDFVDIYWDADERKAVAEAINDSFPGARVSAADEMT